MLNDIEQAASPDSSVQEFTLEDFGGNKKMLPVYEVLSQVQKGYKNEGKEHYEYHDYIEESQKTLEQAQSDAERTEKEAFEKGYREGLKKAYQEVKEQTAAQTEEFSTHLEEILQSVETFWTEMLEENRESMMRLIVETVKVVICGELKSNHDVILNVVQKIFKEVQDAQKILLWINPQDLEVLKEHKQDIIEMLGKDKKLLISTEPDMQPGGCRLSIENQKIDADIKTMVKEMEKSLLMEFS